MAEATCGDDGHDERLVRFPNRGETCFLLSSTHNSWREGGELGLQRRGPVVLGSVLWPRRLRERDLARAQQEGDGSDQRCVVHIL